VQKKEVDRMKKELDMKSRRRIGKAVAQRYQWAKKKEKRRILNEFAKTAFYPCFSYPTG